MSQGDYIKYIKTTQQLTDQKHFKPILNSGAYSTFFGYAIVKELDGASIEFGKATIYDMTVNDVSGCPIFLTCQNTNLRPNRVPNNFNPMFRLPTRPLTAKQRGKTILDLPMCKCPNK